jgi:histidyl-tRNA synthetase
LDSAGRGEEDWSIVTKTSSFTGPKGGPDCLAPAAEHVVAVRGELVRVVRLGGYGHVELPIFEETALPARGAGESMGAVGKQMRTFTDRRGQSYSLRPEGAAVGDPALIDVFGVPLGEAAMARLVVLAAGTR